jgi:hypothetical protein
MKDKIELHFLKQLKDRDVVIYVLRTGFNLSSEKIAELKHLSIDTVIQSYKRSKKLIDIHEETIAAIQASFDFTK